VITIFTPEYGDDVQLFKAGLMEIGDIIVINKSDKPGADDALREIGIAVDRGARSNGWHVPVLLAEAVSGSGLAGLADVVESHRQSIQGKGKTSSRKAEHLEAFLTALLKEELWQKISARITTHEVFKECSNEVLSGRMDPYSAVHIILERLEHEWTSH
jgi:LAO/AO transport system kinase